MQVWAHEHSVIPKPLLSCMPGVHATSPFSLDPAPPSIFHRSLSSRGLEVCALRGPHHVGT